MDDLFLEYMCEFATPCAFIFACGCAFAYVLAPKFEAIFKKNLCYFCCRMSFCDTILVVECLVVFLF
jgi:hypothetical protein